MDITKQILGILALTCWSFSIQQKKKTNILLLQIVANVLYAGQYFILNAVSAGCMNIISVLRSIVFFENEKRSKENSKTTLFIFTALIILVGILTFNSLLSLIPIVITLMYTYSTWQKNTKIIRFTFLIAACLWIVYNFIVGAYAPLIGNVIEVISGIISIIRFDIKKIDNTNNSKI